MASAREEFSVDAVRAVLLENGGKLTNTDLAKHFRKYLLDPEHSDQNRRLLKEYVNSVAVTKRIGDQKYVVLKGDNLRDKQRASSVCSSEDAASLNSLSMEDQPTRESSIANARPSSGTISHKEAMRDTEFLETNDQFVPMPVAPPRRRHSEKENKPLAPSEVEIQKILNGDATEDVVVVEESVSVKERALKLNKIESESQLNRLTKGNAVKKHLKDKNADDDDTASVTSLDSNAKEWIVKAAQADYHALIKLLKADPRLAKFKDFATGYTALHWAAKHGKTEIVKLIAGTHHVDVNIRSRGGYTPLHLAAMFKRHDVYELLLNVYHAEKTIRDYNGLMAEDHLRERKCRSTKSSEHRTAVRRNSRRHSDKEAVFLRLGSFNVKVRKTAESLGNKSKPTKLHKGWGSADNLPDNVQDRHLMPPPKTSHGSHKSHKHRKGHIPNSKSDTFH